MADLSSMLVAAHDLKAPVSLMRQLALSLDLANSAAERAEISGQIVHVADRALRHINDLTRIARLEDGLFVMEPVSVRGLCDEIHAELAELFHSEQRSLAIAYSNHSRLAVANRELLHSVIYNFCTNAIRYSDLGTTSHLRISDVGGRIRIAVRDFGPALPMPIYRELRTGGLSRPTSISMRPDSSGLGLYVASRFARYMHAELGCARHRDGVSLFVDLIPSRQASLFV